MFTQNTTYNTLLDFMRAFPDNEVCRKHLEHIRWGDSPTCPHCEHNEKVYRLKGGKQFKCSACRKKFTVLVGTFFENTNVGLHKWFLAIWFATSH